MTGSGRDLPVAFDAICPIKSKFLHFTRLRRKPGCPSSAVVCYGGWIKSWRSTQRVSSEALAKEGMLRRVSPKTSERPQL